MLLTKLINFLPLNIAANKANEIPINQGLDNIVISRDFITGLLLCFAFVFILLGLFKNSET